MKLKVATNKQRAALRSRVVAVRVRASGRARVRLTGTGMKARKVRFRARGKRAKRVRMKLTWRGWSSLSTCGRHRVRVKGTYRRAVRRGKRTVRRKASVAAKRRLARDAGLCAKPPACDPLDPALCLLPWPNDYFTREDAGSETGRRLALADSMMPANASGKPIDAAPYNESDGFSPGQPILAKVPGFDSPEALAATGPVSLAALGEYAKPDAPIVLVDAASGERVPIWVELDASSATDEQRLLEIEPAASLEPGARYIVAMRDLKRADGSEIEAGPTFRAYRDRTRVTGDPDGARRAHFERLFRELRRAGIDRDDLYLAWDFTVASDESLSSRLLAMRDEAFADLGDADLADRVVTGQAPGFEIDSVTEAPNPRIAREVRGTITVPCYLWPSCEMETGPDPAGSFKLDSDGLPIRNVAEPAEARFTCIVPEAAEAEPARPSLYGHGLFSSLEEVTIRPHQDLAQDHDMVLCATDQTGLTTAELPHVIGIVSDFSRFPEITDGMQQGMLNELYLGRALVHPDGFSSAAAFHAGGEPEGASVIDTGSRLSYSGYSMGGIMGGMLTAVAPDFDRAVLGVPGMRFSLLLPRSSYWTTFGALIKNSYPRDIETPLVVSLLQVLWDRGEAQGYAHRMTTDPLPNTPPHEVLLSTAFGDHQVTNWGTGVLARTVGAQARTPILDPGRWAGVDELWGIPRIGSFPYQGSAMVMWDIGPVREGAPGVPPPPVAKVPNLAGDDPHDMIWDMPAERAAVSDFLGADGSFADPCPSATPCYAGDWNGPGGP